MKSHSVPTLRLAAVSDVSPPPRRTMARFALRDADVILDDMIAMFSEFAVLLGTNYAITVDGVVHLLPANRGAC